MIKQRRRIRKCHSLPVSFLRKQGSMRGAGSSGNPYRLLWIAAFAAMTLWTIDYGLLTIDCYAELVSSTELIEKAKEYNGKVVEFQGEVIGDVMGRGNYAWVNLKDGTGAIGIFCKKGLIERVVQYKGDYNYKGDILQVKGVFHRACPQHGGDLDIHMYEVIKVSEGFKTPHEVRFSKIVTAFSLAVAAMGLAVLSAFKTRKRRGPAG